MSLIPEKPLIISPSLAATLGLEEAVLLQMLGEFRDHAEHGQSSWIEISLDQLTRFLPFWQTRDIQRIAQSLKDKGVIALSSAPVTESGQLCFALEGQTSNPAPIHSAPPNNAGGARLIASQWLPGEDTFRQLAQYNIPRDFALQLLPEFVTYWRERNEPSYSWESKFIKRVLREWREQESDIARQKQASAMHAQWRPSQDAMEILIKQAGINANFIEDAIPEFILYWRERGESSSAWNSKFINHVRHQWARYTNAMENDTRPKPLPDDWQPSESLYEVLALANISKAFAIEQVAEFVLYWRESGQVHGSWNTRFLQHVKRRWARHCNLQQESQHERLQSTDQPVRTRDRSLEEDLSDRSWAQ